MALSKETGNIRPKQWR